MESGELERAGNAGSAWCRSKRGAFTTPIDLRAVGTITTHTRPRTPPTRRHEDPGTHRAVPRHRSLGYHRSQAVDLRISSTSSTFHQASSCPGQRAHLVPLLLSTSPELPDSSWSRRGPSSGPETHGFVSVPVTWQLSPRNPVHARC